MIADSFKTIKQFAQAELKEKGSRFICQVHPVTSREQAEKHISAISARYYDATHNCYAYYIGLGQQSLSRFSDDGEPSGTAGKPILQALTGRELTNVVAVVTRYFGGTKLGTGGLVRAYSSVTSQALDLAETRIDYLTTIVHVVYEYHYANLVKKIIDNYSAEVKSSDYQTHVSQFVLVRNSKTEEFKNQLINQSSGNIKIETPA